MKNKYPPSAWIILGVMVAMAMGATIGAVQLVWDQYQRGFPPEGPGLPISIGLLVAMIGTWVSMIMTVRVVHASFRRQPQKEHDTDG